jgi:hypothetical protein
MEEYSSTPRPTLPASKLAGGQAKQNRLHALAFLKIGIFEFFFVIVALLLLFGIFNYFNILSVSDVFPNQLGWLPHQIQTKLVPQGKILQDKVDLCAPFTTDKGEVSCEEAKTIALKELPGSVLAIDRKTMNFAGQNGKSNTYKLWLVTIQLKKQINKHNEVVAGIDTVDGKIKYSALK